jgi:glucuronoarabinoxylan endo-1,4-beta-xylanase
MYPKARGLLSVAAIGFAALPLFVGATASAADATVDLTATKQMIRGFGASSAWCGTVSTSVMDSLYKDLGYSILRVRIEENVGDGWSSGNYGAWAPELANAKNAIARGAIVFASPWNPPASMKSGGKLMTSKYADYANYLKAYVKYFADNAAPLYAVSIQNEPDFAATWTAWTATDLLNFLKDQGATLSSATKVIMPESFQFIHAMSDPSLNDATVASYISIIGGHLYGGKIQDYPLAKNQGKELWETEHYFDDDSMKNIMALAQELHDCMVTASMNAYVYWWITYGNGLATSSGTIFKRAYTLGQFAKYIRPGYYRVDATANPATGVSVSAYRGEDKVVIVAVNTGSASVNQNFVVRGGTATQVSSWQTTANSNMAAGQSYPVSSGAFTAPLPAQSITTFVGTVSGMAGSSDGGASDSGTGGAAGDAAASANGGNSGSGGRSGTGGASGAGGATVSETGGSSNSGGHAGASASGGAAGANAGGAAAGGTSASGSGSGGSSNGGTTTTTAGQSSGCSCTLAARNTRAQAHNLFSFGALFVLCGLVLARRQ